MGMDTGDDPSSLDEVGKALEQLSLYASDTTRASSAITVLADASRHDLTTREHLSDPQILKSLVGVIDCSMNDSLETVDLALRCIGNACIDNDVGRKIMTTLGFSWALQCLQTGTSSDDTTRCLTIKALYNICSDYEPAQKKCYEAHVHHEMVMLMLPQAEFSMNHDALFIELLFWICSQKPPNTTEPEPWSSYHRETLLFMSRTYPLVSGFEAEDWAMLLETCLMFIRDRNEQREIIQDKLVDHVWFLFQQNESNIGKLEMHSEDRKLLVPLSTSLIWCLSDIAANPQFGAFYPLEDDWICEWAISYIRDFDPVYETRLRSMTAACHMLGNLLWAEKSPSKFAYLIQSERLHKPIFTILSTVEDTELLHAATGLLTHLSRSSLETRKLIGSDAAAGDALRRVCQHNNPQIKQDAITLLRALGRDCPENRERFAGLSKDAMSSLSSTEIAMTDVPG